MFVLCETCRNHYDDLSQSENCLGPGRTATPLTDNLGVDSATSHVRLRAKAVDIHVTYTVLARGGRSVTYEADVRARRVSTALADASGDYLPI